MANLNLLTDNHAYVIFKPDTVFQNLESNIWEYFKKKNMQIVLKKFAYITREKRKLLYRDFVISSRTNWDMGTEFYELGPALHLILWGEYPKEFKSLSEYISKSLKGNFIPEVAEPDTVRGKYNSLNPVFNLIHSSDSTEESNEEMKIFFTEDELKKLHNQMPSENLHLDKKQVTYLNFYDLFYGIKRYIVSSVQEEDNKRAYILFINDCVASINGYGTLNKRSHNRFEQKEFFLQSLKYEREKYVNRISNNKLRDLLELLCDYHKFPHLDYHDLFSKLNLLGIVHTDWERYLIKTSMYYITFR